MTLDDYLSPGRFPLSTQPGLTPGQQFLLDSIRMGQARDMQEAGEPFTEKGQALLAELEAKGEAFASDPGLRDEVAAAKRDGRWDASLANAAAGGENGEDLPAPEMSTQFDSARHV